MNSKSNLNHPPDELNPIQDGRVVSKLPGDLDNFALEATLAQESFELLEHPSLKSKYVLQKALYIVEIGDKFCFLDYRVGGGYASQTSPDSQQQSTQVRTQTNQN